MKTPKRSVACFLGAGYSFIAGVPLAKDLLRAKYVLALSERSRQRFAVLREHYEDWQQHNPSEYPEQYLGRLYTGSFGWNAPPWSSAVEYVSTVNSIGRNTTCILEPQSSIFQPNQSPLALCRTSAVLERGGEPG